MSVKSKLVAVLTFTASISALAATPSLFGSCDSDGECFAVLSRSLPETEALCGERTASIAWRKGFQAFLLQCVGTATDHQDNMNYLVTGTDLVGLYGRYVKISFFERNPAASVPDKFGAVPVCVPANLKSLHKSVFVLLYKRPNENRNSYCYDMAYLSASGDGVRLDTNAGPVDATDRAYFSRHVSDRTRQRVKELIQVFRTWHDEQPN